MHASLEQKRARPDSGRKTGFAIVVEFEVGEGVYRNSCAREGERGRLGGEELGACRRFDVLSPSGEAVGASVLLYEIYDDRAAFEAHLASGHYARFDRITEPMILRKTVRHFDLHEGAEA